MYPKKRKVKKEKNEWKKNFSYWNKSKSLPSTVETINLRATRDEDELENVKLTKSFQHLESTGAVKREFVCVHMSTKRLAMAHRRLANFKKEVFNYFYIFWYPWTSNRIIPISLIAKKIKSMKGRYFWSFSFQYLES